MDLTQTIEADSTQVNADDLTAGGRTITITDVTAGTTEQPVYIHSSEFPDKTFRPNKSMRRVLVQAWGPQASDYIGRRVTIYRDPSVKWAGQEVGGVRISHLSHIDGPLRLQLTTTRGKRAPFTVDPLPDAPAPAGPTVEQVRASEDINELRDLWTHATPDVQAAIKARVAELQEAT